MAQELKIWLFGSFKIEGESLPSSTILTPRQQNLLAYLLLHEGAPQSRQQLAYLLWPDSTDRQARTNLRQLLHRLRHDCPALEPFLILDNQYLWWKNSENCWVDVAAFKQLMAQTETAKPASQTVHLIPVLRSAVATYRGNLLPDCYDDWINDHRLRLRNQYLSALQRLVNLLAASHEYAAAIPFAQRFIVDEPINEAGYRQLMRLQAQNGNRAEALQTYQLCAAALRRELDVAPSPKTTAQYQQILDLQQPAKRPGSSAATQKLPLIGRRREWDLLQRAWQRTQAGQTHFVLIHGEAGIGKTRLIEELADWTRIRGASVAQARAFVAQDQLSFAPIASWLRSDDIRSFMSDLDPVWVAEISRLVPELLNQYTQLPAPQPLTEGWQRTKFFDALARAILLPAKDKPLILILEDLQWCDRETISWLSYFLPLALGKPLLFAATLRTGALSADHPLLSVLADWRRERELTEIRPRPLDARETGQLAKEVADRELSAAEITILTQETEGNPLFIVEYTRAALEQIASTGPVTIMAGKEILLPPRVQATVEARFRNLSAPARDLLDTAAVIGREFSLDIIFRVTRQEEYQLISSLDELQQRHIIREQEADNYDFSHDKLRAVAYAQISKARRQLNHRLVAEALASIYSQDTAPVSARLAQHYEKARLIPQAIFYYQQAAEVAGLVYANGDMVDFLTKALDLLATNPEGIERDKVELRLRVALGPPLVALEGYGSRRVIAAYERALALSTRVNLPPDPRALRGLAIASIQQAKHAQAAEFGRKILEQADAGQDPMLLVEGHYTSGVSAFWQGKFALSRTHLQLALQHLSPEQQDAHIAQYGQDPQSVCLSRLAYALWYLGFPAEAWQMMDEALRISQQMGHPYSQVYAHSFAAYMAMDALEYSRFQLETERMAELVAKHHFDYQRENLLVSQGYLLAREEQSELGLKQMLDILSGWREAGFELFVPVKLGWVAEIYRLFGRLAEALATLEDAIEVSTRTGEKYAAAELHHAYGQVLAETGEPKAAQRQLQLALDVANKQSARLVQLRILTTLGRLWMKSGDGNKFLIVRQTLQDTCQAFPAGTDAPDLKAARELLAMDP